MVSDILYLARISHLLPKIKQEGKGTWWCRCPYCGDSKKDPNKRRGCFRSSREVHGALTFKCYNCGVFRMFRELLKDLDSTIYRDYLRESVKASRGTPALSEDFWDTKAPEAEPAELSGPGKYFQRVLSLEESHPARLYLEARKIPKDRHPLIWFSPEFRKAAHEFNPGIFEKINKDSARLVFPIMSGKYMNGHIMTGFQGRAIDPTETPRYYTVIAPGTEKFYGLERIDRSRPAIITEGPIDSLFLDNAVALCGATNATDVAVDDPIFFLDQEPRNPEIVNRMRKLIKAGHVVAILPDQFREMDANEIVLSTGMSREELTFLVLSNTYAGARALLKLAQWART